MSGAARRAAKAAAAAVETTASPKEPRPARSNARSKGESLWTDANDKSLAKAIGDLLKATESSVNEGWADVAVNVGSGRTEATCRCVAAPCRYRSLHRGPARTHRLLSLCPCLCLSRCAPHRQLVRAMIL